jgi:O-antigen/teichoic acid export membrane protein
MNDSNTYSKSAVIQNISWLLFDKLILILSNLIIIFVVANYYGAEKYGIFQYATNIVLMLEVIVQLIDGRIVKKKYTNLNQNDVVFNVSFGKLILSSIALIFGIILLFLFKNSEKTFKIILFVLLFDSIIKSFRFGMENRFDYLLLSKRTVIACDLGLAVGTILQIIVVGLNLNITYIAYIQVLSSLIGLIILFLQYCFNFQIDWKKLKVDIFFIKEIIIESIPLAIAAAAATIYTKCDSVMLGSLLSTKEVGIYSISSKLISMLQLFLVPIQTTLFVKLLEWYKQGANVYKRNYVKVTTTITWFAIMGTICSFVILPFIMRFLKQEYFLAIKPYKILSIGTIFAYNAILRSSHLTLTGNGKILLYVQIITLVINVILNYFFIRLWGMNGAAIATTISQGISLFVSNIFFDDTKFIFKCQYEAFAIFKTKN